MISRLDANRRTEVCWPSIMLLAALVFVAAPRADAAVISVGTFPELNPAPSIAIPAGAFLVPIAITGAVNLDNWQFDLLFDPAVVEVIDPMDGSSGLYGAEFIPGDGSSVSFILGGFAFNALGMVDDVAGSYPLLFGGPSGDGILAYVVFGFLPGQDNHDPGFTIDVPDIPGVPEPGTLALFAAASLTLAFTRRRIGADKRQNPSQEKR